MNPTLKKLSSPSLSRVDVADLIERHIGDGCSETHCQEALDALRRVRDERTRMTALVIVRIQRDDLDSCMLARHVINTLRSMDDN